MINLIEKKVKISYIIKSLVEKKNQKRYNSSKICRPKKLIKLALKMLLLNKYLVLKSQYKNNFFPKKKDKYTLYLSLKKLLIKEKTKNIILNLTTNLAINTKVSFGANSANNYNIMHNYLQKTVENRALLPNLQTKYGIIRIHCSFSNLNISLTTLDGKIIQWISAGSDKTQTKRTRMSSRAVGALLIRFFSTYKKKTGIRYVKVVFSGPSTKFRGKFLSIIKSWSRNLRFNVICVEEAFRRSFNGCRLARKKR